MAGKGKNPKKSTATSLAYSEIMDECGTTASIDGMLSVMIIVTGLAFMFALPGLIGFSADMQQGYQITVKSIQALDIGRAIIFSQEGQNYKNRQIV